MRSFFRVKSKEKRRMGAERVEFTLAGARGKD
jgi:hypothetical protein